MSEIEIPDAAIKAAAAVVIGYIDDDPPPDSVERVVRHELEAAAPLIVAAHLRQLACSDELSNLCDPYGGTTGEAVDEWLRHEADELDGGAA